MWLEALRMKRMGKEAIIREMFAIPSFGDIKSLKGSTRMKPILYPILPLSRVGNVATPSFVCQRLINVSRVPFPLCGYLISFLNPSELIEVKISPNVQQVYWRLTLFRPVTAKGGKKRRQGETPSFSFLSLSFLVNVRSILPSPSPVQCVIMAS